MLGLDEDSNYRRHLREEFDGSAGVSEEGYDDEGEEGESQGVGPVPNEHLVEITGKYVLYTKGHVVQANSLRRLAWKVFRMRLGKLIMGG